MSSLALREFHPFQTAGQDFVYLVPSAAVFQLDDAASAILDCLRQGPVTSTDLVDRLSTRFPTEEIHETLRELLQVQAIGDASVPLPVATRGPIPQGIPLTTMVLNVTNQCNLACTY